MSYFLHKITFNYNDKTLFIPKLALAKFVLHLQNSVKVSLSYLKQYSNFKPIKSEHLFYYRNFDSRSVNINFDKNQIDTSITLLVSNGEVRLQSGIGELMIGKILGEESEADEIIENVNRLYCHNITHNFSTTTYTTQFSIPQWEYRKLIVNVLMAAHFNSVKSLADNCKLAALAITKLPIQEDLYPKKYDFFLISYYICYISYSSIAQDAYNFIKKVSHNCYNDFIERTSYAYDYFIEKVSYAYNYGYNISKNAYNGCVNNPYFCSGIVTFNTLAVIGAYYAMHQADNVPDNREDVTAPNHDENSLLLASTRELISSHIQTNSELYESSLGRGVTHSPVPLSAAEYMLPSEDRLAANESPLASMGQNSFVLPTSQEEPQIILWQTQPNLAEENTVSLIEEFDFLTRDLPFVLTNQQETEDQTNSELYASSVEHRLPDLSIPLPAAEEMLPSENRLAPNESPPAPMGQDSFVLPTSQEEHQIILWQTEPNLAEENTVSLIAEIAEFDSLTLDLPFVLTNQQETYEQRQDYEIQNSIFCVDQEAIARINELTINQVLQELWPSSIPSYQHQKRQDQLKSILKTCLITQIQSTTKVYSKELLLKWLKEDLKIDFPRNYNSPLSLKSQINYQLAGAALFYTFQTSQGLEQNSLNSTCDISSQSHDEYEDCMLFSVGQKIVVEANQSQLTNTKTKIANTIDFNNVTCLATISALIVTKISTIYTKFDPEAPVQSGFTAIANALFLNDAVESINWRIIQSTCFEQGKTISVKYVLNIAKPALCSVGLVSFIPCLRDIIDPYSLNLLCSKSLDILENKALELFVLDSLDLSLLILN